MPAFTATAPGKIILFGEHAVVYGEAAIAAPVQNLQARTVVTPRVKGKSGEIQILAADIGLSASLQELKRDHPLREAVHQVVGDHDLEDVPACKIEIISSIPASSGLGSGAAVSACLIRAFSAFLGKRFSDEEVSVRVYEVEKIHHGSPSGIDNTVICYQKTLCYRKGEGFRFLKIPQPFSILIIPSGSPGSTLQAVSQVRQAWTEDPETYNRIFSAIGEISTTAVKQIETGSIPELGPLMDRNHQLLQELGVSTPELDRLAAAARQAGALGAKLSGGGLGGHLIALIEDHPDRIVADLLSAGAASPILTRVASQP